MSARWRGLMLMLLLCLIFSSGAAARAEAVETESLFDAANRLYEQGKHSEAATAYEQALAAGRISPALYFNLGNACFKAGQTGKAIAAYRLAEKLEPRDPDLRANLQFVRNQVQNPSRPPARLELWLGRLTLNEWTALAGCALWICLLTLALLQLRPGLKPALRSVAWLSGLASLALGVCLGTAAAFNSAPVAIVTSPDAAVRNGPLEESPNAFTVHDGAELKVLDKKDGWVQVGLGNRTGWLKTAQVIILPHQQ